MLPVVIAWAGQHPISAKAERKLPAIWSGATAIVRSLPSLSIARDVENHNHGDVLDTNSNNDGAGHRSGAERFRCPRGAG